MSLDNEKNIKELAFFFGVVNGLEKPKKKRGSAKISHC